MRSFLMLLQLLSIAYCAFAAAHLPMMYSAENAPPTAVRPLTVYNEEPTRVRSHMISYNIKPSVMKPFTMKKPTGISLPPTAEYPRARPEQLPYVLNKSAYLTLREESIDNDWQTLDPKTKPKGDLEN